jgi:hypothetical protein
MNFVINGGIHENSLDDIENRIEELEANAAR